MLFRYVATIIIATFLTTSFLIHLTSSNGLDFVIFKRPIHRKNPKSLSFETQFVKPKNPTVYDIYKFPEYHSKWQNYTYQNLIQMTLTEKNSFFQYKENQYAKQAQWIKNLCKKFQKDAIVRKTNMCEPSPHCKQIIFLSCLHFYLNIEIEYLFRSKMYDSIRPYRKTCILSKSQSGQFNLVG